MIASVPAAARGCRRTPARPRTRCRGPRAVRQVPRRRRRGRSMSTTTAPARRRPPGRAADRAARTSGTRRPRRPAVGEHGETTSARSTARPASPPAAPRFDQRGRLVPRCGSRPSTATPPPAAGRAIGRPIRPVPRNAIRCDIRSLSNYGNQNSVPRTSATLRESGAFPGSGSTAAGGCAVERSPIRRPPPPAAPLRFRSVRPARSPSTGRRRLAAPQLRRAAPKCIRL